MLSAFTTFIATDSILLLGTGKNYKELAEAMGPATLALHSHYLNLTNIEAALWSLARANKELIDSLAQQLRTAQAGANPNGILIDGLKQAVNTLVDLQFHLRSTWIKVWQARDRAYIEAEQNHFDLVTAFGIKSAKWFQLPPQPTPRLPADLLPRR